LAEQPRSIPAEWEPRLASDVAELVDAAASLNRLVAAGESPVDFILALPELAPRKDKA
jgi:hypothetical protein